MKTPDQMMVSAITAFQQWRETRKSSATKTPTALQQQAVALLKHFSSSKITSALNLSGANIKRWVKLHKDKQSHPQFVALPTIDEPPAPLSLVLDFNNGCQMRFSGELSPAQLTAITQTLVASPRAVS